MVFFNGIGFEQPIKVDLVLVTVRGVLEVVLGVGGIGRCGACVGSRCAATRNGLSS